LGRYLYEATGIPVVGVAKTFFHGHTGVMEVFRGESARPLFVSTAGFDLNQAASGVHAMSGPFRIPTLLKRVDALSRL
jgi:deoxyribonuclease V